MAERRLMRAIRVREECEMGEEISNPKRRYLGEFAKSKYSRQKKMQEK
jgi:hypothetical protein